MCKNLHGRPIGPIRHVDLSLLVNYFMTVAYSPASGESRIFNSTSDGQIKIKNRRLFMEKNNCGLDSEWMWVKKRLHIMPSHGEKTQFPNRVIKCLTILSGTSPARSPLWVPVLEASGSGAKLYQFISWSPLQLLKRDQVFAGGSCPKNNMLVVYIKSMA